MEIENCIKCEHVDRKMLNNYDLMFICTLKDSKEIVVLSAPVIMELGIKNEVKTPDWCPLENKT